MNPPLRVKVVLLVALAMLPVGAIAVALALANFHRIADVMETSLLTATIGPAREEREALLTTQRLLTTLAVLPDVLQVDGDRCTERLSALTGTIDHVETAAVTDAHGRIVCSAGVSAPVKSIADRPWFQEMKQEGGVGVVGPLAGFLADQLVVIVGSPIKAANGHFGGVVILAFGAIWFQSLLDARGASPTTHIAFVDDAGTVIASKSSEDDWLPPADQLKTLLAEAPTTFLGLDERASSGRFAVAALIDRGLYIVAQAERPLIPRDRLWPLIAGIAFPLVMWCVAGAVTWYAIDRFVLRPILRVRTMAHAMALGDLGARPHLHADAPDEIRELGDTLVGLSNSVRQREDALKRSLAERDILLREVHHRVKNNLQIVTSLLNMQMKRARTETERLTLRTTQDRIYALAMIHGSLYRGESLRRLRMDLFLAELLGYLDRANRSPARRVDLQTDMEPIEADTSQAIALALLVTEVVTNAYKHAWPDGVTGTLSVGLAEGGDGNVVLTVADDGANSNHGDAEAGGLGRRLIEGFARQLNGTVSVDMTRGYRLSVTMPPLIAG
jgi:two-component sensor histidine kinase